MSTLNEHENIFAPLFKIAFGLGGEDTSGVVHHYHSDLGWDAITLSRAQKGDIFLWGVRDCGSHIVHVTEDNRKNVVGMVRAGICPPGNWWVLRVTKTTNHGCTSGTVDKVMAANRDELVDFAFRLLEEDADAKIQAQEQAWETRLRMGGE